MTNEQPKKKGIFATQPGAPKPTQSNASQSLPFPNNVNHEQGSQQGSNGNKQGKSTAATMNELMHNRKNTIITDQTVNETEAAKKVQKALEASKR
jgi:hypothetical protein